MVNNQNDHENKDILFHSLSTLWLEETKMKVKESTHVKYTNLLKWYINPQLGSYFLSELNYTVCSRFCMQLLSCFGKNGDGLSEKTASDVLSAVKSIVKYATKIGYTPDISIFSVSVRVQQKPIRVFSLNEEKRLVNQLDPIKSRYDCGILLCLFTGLRIGELLLFIGTLMIHDIFQPHLHIRNRGDNISSHQTLAGGIKNAERYAAEYICPADEWLPAPNTLESARNYRTRIMPIVDRFGKLLLKLYTQFVNLKSKYNQLLNRNKDLTSRVDYLHSKCKDMEQEVSDYRLLRQYVGPETVDHALEEARKVVSQASKNRLRRDSFEH